MARLRLARLRPRLPVLRRPLAATLAVLSLLVVLAAGSSFVFVSSPRGSSSLPRSRRVAVARGALDVEGLASFASFSVLAGSPIPLGLGALFRRAEDVAATAAPEEEATWPEFALPSFGSEPTPKVEEVPECTGPRLQPRRMARVIGMALAPLALIWALLRAALTFHAVETPQSRTLSSPAKGHRALLTAARAPPSKMSATSLALVPIVAAAAMQARGGSALAQKAERASGVPPALMGLAAWLLLMFAIQHSWVVVPFLSEAQYQYFPIVATFVAGYAVIVLEEQTEINKAATALILGVLVWALVGTGIDMTASEFDTAIAETLQNVAEVVFFLLGALTIVEIMDAHKGFDIITSAIKATNQRDLLITIGVLTFLLSSVLNNLTVVIVMVSLLQRLVQDDDFRMKLGGLVVVASNAGGAWTPIGDITTTMLYIGGQVTTVPLLTNLFVPSSLCLLGAMGYELLFVIEGRKPFQRRKEKSISTEAPAGQQLVFWGGLLGMVGVPVFTAFTKCPAWTGMMLVLGLLGLITSLLHEPGDDRYSLKGALKRVEVPDALFFLGVLFAVGALERVGLLKDFAEQLSQLLPDDSLVAIFLGFASAIVDNVPLVAATQGMYDLSAHPANDGLWNLITYCAATGGSLLVIGSAAGVAFMGMEKEVSFGWYVRSVAPAALVGYLLGVGGVLGQQALGLSVRLGVHVPHVLEMLVGTIAAASWPRDLMWAFPSFAVFLDKSGETAPAGFPMWARWLCLATFWPGVIWYLYYKLLVEDDLRYYRGLGIGGSLVIVPFALGLFAGVFGEFAYGALEGGFFDNAFSTAFYSAFAWIYLNQWFLYNKVNQLFEEIGRPAPLDPWGLLIPGWNFVTGIRQIHFLAEYWAIQRGEELPRDAFAELFPFAKKPTLTLVELATTPSLWFNIPALIG
ncbi:Na(+)/H(+) antiporter NhaD [Symbiodinium microadriaticum]|uniref:Na(+)/H(+) antiporter NhaD n=1 Tax=Symbiodinium microadriaticum TaxID=2951 RepID=A0A1Q9DT67_SYMMI|nr:Na(+)/H(+) antiporter NhaD [Symbiodinium microadriaticum]